MALSSNDPEGSYRHRLRKVKPFNDRSHRIIDLGVAAVVPIMALDCEIKLREALGTCVKGRLRLLAGQWIMYTSSNGVAYLIDG